MNLLKLYERLSQWPCGKWLFARLICLKAPYFGSIHPAIPELRPGRCVVTIDKRRRHRNHINTVHAIAMCNMAELAAGLAIDVSLPAGWRWIPKAMRVEYLKKATTALTATCEFDPAGLHIGDCLLLVKVIDLHEVEVFRAEVTMHVSEDRSRKTEDGPVI